MFIFSLKRQLLKDGNAKIDEKFVFKIISEKELSGVCQQGFSICECCKNETQKYFASTSKDALTYENNSTFSTF